MSDIYYRPDEPKILMDLSDIDLKGADSLERIPDDQYSDHGVNYEEEFEFTEYNLDVVPAVAIEKTAPKVEDKPVKVEADNPAEKAVEKSAAKRAVPPASKPEVLESFIQLPDELMRTVIGKLSKTVSGCVEFPEASTFLSLLGSASAAVAANYAVQYRTGSPISTGLYVIIEQPPATQKSYILGMGMNPYSMAMGDHNKKVKATLNEIVERYNGKTPDNVVVPRYGFVVATDATSAAMDKHLAECSEGRFVVASAEQSALISLFPESNSFASTNELILKGYAGEYVAGMRGGRAAFSGIANGTVVLIAQSGTSRRVLSASNGSGMAERFIFMAEPSMLGNRDFEGGFPSSSERKPFETAVRACISKYSDKVIDGDGEPLDPESLEQLRASANGYQMIKQARKDMEPRLGELKDSGDMVLLSWLGKFETHVLKIAAVLHVFECLGCGTKVSETIPDKVLVMAMDFIETMSDHMSDLLHDAGESGKDAEEEAVIMTIDGKRFSLRELKQRLKNKKPFKAMGKTGYKAVERRIEKMINEGTLVVRTDGSIGVV